MPDRYELGVVGFINASSPTTITTTPTLDQQLPLLTIDSTTTTPLITPINLLDQQGRQVPAGGDRSASCCG
jgi:hypothetical protein